MNLTLVIPAAGRGSRLERSNSRMPKGMIALQGKPILEFALMTGLQSPVDKIVFVISKDGDAIPEYFGTTYEGIPVSYVMQPEPRGLAHAVSMAERHVSDFMLVINGDEIYLDTSHSEMCNYVSEKGADGLVGFLHTPQSYHIRRGYGLLLDPYGRVLKLVEKPSKAWNNLLGVGTWIVPAEFFEFFRRTPINVMRGERDFVEVVQLMVAEGRSIYGFDLKGEFVNINTSADLVHAEVLLTAHLKASHGLLTASKSEHSRAYS